MVMVIELRLIIMVKYSYMSPEVIIDVGRISLDSLSRYLPGAYSDLFSTRQYYTICPS